MGVIYSIMNPKGKLYVGKTYNLRKRINSHKYCTRKGSDIILHNSIRKYSWENHHLEIIEEVADEMLNERELFWIATLKTYCYENKMGMNMTRGGEGQRSTWMHDIERRKKASEYFTKNPPFKGKNHTDDNKRIIGEKASKRNKSRGQLVPKWGAEKSYEQSRKPIVVYDKNGEFIGEFVSLSETARKLYVNRGDISAVLAKRQVHSSEMFFFYKTENYPLHIDVNGLVLKKVKRSVLLLNSDKNIIKEYSAAKEAAKDLHIPQTTISRAAQYNNGKKIRTGHIFVYKDEYEINQVTNN